MYSAVKTDKRAAKGETANEGTAKGGAATTGETERSPTVVWIGSLQMLENLAPYDSTRDKVIPPAIINCIPICIQCLGMVASILTVVSVLQQRGQPAGGTRLNHILRRICAFAKLLSHVAITDSRTQERF